MSSFATANIAEVVDQLTIDEAILLTAGVGLWYTHPIPRLEIPSIKMTNGPNGVTGTHLFMSTPAQCLPNATALASTFNTSLIDQMGREIIAEEAKTKAASLLLGPTCNIQRNPLGGRSFESFSEDPYLSGMMTAAFSKGVQAGGIGVTLKHFVGNDKEHDRFGYDSIVSPRTLREVYLMPFMLAEKFARPWAYMTAYNRVNGVHMSENKTILKNILRDEWGSDAMIMSDWLGVYSVDHAINAGLDLEMPGTNKWRTLDLMNRSIQSRKITKRDVRERAKKVLQLVQKCARGAPEVLDGPQTEHAGDPHAHRDLMMKVATESIVLLKNEDNLLPLDHNTQQLKNVVIIGPNAKAKVLSGGGSAAMKPSFFVSPFDGIAASLRKLNPDINVSYCEGARAYMQMPTLESEVYTEDGRPGWMGYFYSHEKDDSMIALPNPTAVQYIDETRIYLSIEYPWELTKRFTLRLRGTLKPRAHDCEFQFGLMSAGRAKLYIDDELVVDNWTCQTRGADFFGNASTEERGVCALKAGVAYRVLVEFVNVRAPADDDPTEAVMDTGPGLRLGGAEVRDADALLAQAEEAARAADAAVVVVGLNADWEAEGYDRAELALPGRVDALVARVARANARTVVVAQSGSAVAMPWADEVRAIVQAWYLGNVTGDAIGAVLTGEVNPSGKLSLTFPKRIEDVPSYGHFHSEHGEIRYAEGLFVGYKHYHHRGIAPQWHFGHGLSYTTFEYSDLTLSSVEIRGSQNPDITLTASVRVTNMGPVTGSETVQLYISYPSTSELTHPPLMLKAFKKVMDLPPGKSEVAKLVLDKYAVSYWDEGDMRWAVESGTYVVRVGRSSAPEDLKMIAEFTIERRLEWAGL